VLFATRPGPDQRVELGFARPVGDGGPTVSSSAYHRRARSAPSDSEPSREDAEWLKSLAPTNIPIRLDARVVKYLKFYRDNTRGRSIIRVWAQKSGKYVPAMQAEFAKAGLPTDLVWLSLIESGHNPTIQSPAGAAGLWQFVPKRALYASPWTAGWTSGSIQASHRSRHPLPERSLPALRHLGSSPWRPTTWASAPEQSDSASTTPTTSGTRTARAGVPGKRRSTSPRSWPPPMVMNNRKAFGIADVTPADALAFDTVTVKPGTSLSRVAAAAQVALPGSKSSTLSSWSRGLRPVRRASRRATSCACPRAGGPKVLEGLNVGTESESETTYTVRFGDTCKSIAAELGVSAERFVKLNGLGDSELLEAERCCWSQGQRAPLGAIRKSPWWWCRRRSSPTPIAAACSIGRAGAIPWPPCRGLRGDAGQVLGWNALVAHGAPPGRDGAPALRPKTNTLERVRHVKENDVRVLVVGSEEFFDYFEAQNAESGSALRPSRGHAAVHRAKVRDDRGSMERVNRRANSDPLAPGESVIVYASQGWREECGGRAGYRAATAGQGGGGRASGGGETAGCRGAESVGSGCVRVLLHRAAPCALTPSSLRRGWVRTHGGLMTRARGEAKPGRGSPRHFDEELATGTGLVAPKVQGDPPITRAMNLGIVVRLGGAPGAWKMVKASPCQPNGPWRAGEMPPS